MKLSNLILAGLAVTVGANADITGVVVDESASPLKDAVVQIKTYPNLLADARTLSDVEGRFSFADASLSIKPVRGELTGHMLYVPKDGDVTLKVMNSAGRVLRTETASVGAGYQRIDNVGALAQGLPQGIYFVAATVQGNTQMIGKIMGNGSGEFSLMGSASKASLKKAVAAGENILVVRKAGFLPETLSVAAAADFGKITLKRDPVEDKIDKLMAGMIQQQVHYFC